MKRTHSSVSRHQRKCTQRSREICLLFGGKQQPENDCPGRSPRDRFRRSAFRQPRRLSEKQAMSITTGLV